MTLPFSVPRSRRLTVLRGVTVALAAWGILALLQTAGLFHALDLKLSDLRFRLRGEQVASSRIALVELDDETIGSYGRWPLPRNTYALLLSALSEAGARAVGVDLLFLGADSYDDRNDLLLAAVTARIPRLVHSVAFHTDPPGPGDRTGPDAAELKIMSRHSVGPPDLPAPEAAAAAVPYPALLEAAPALGHVSVSVDADGVVRRIPPVIEYRGTRLPALALCLVSMYLGDDAPPEVAAVDSGYRVTWPGGGSDFLPTDEEGSSAINFRGDRSAFPNAYTMIEVLEWYRDGRDDLLADAFRDRIVLVGNTAVGEAATDVGATPFNNATPLVFVHANAVDSALTDSFLHRMPDGAYQVILAALALLLGVLVVALPLPVAAVTALGATILVALANQTAFVLWHLDAPATSSLLLPPLAYGGIASYRFIFLERSERIRERELRLARDIQRRLLPNRPPEVPEFDIFGVNIPAQEVGGDYYDWLALDDDRLAVALGDVVGKGVAASLLMSHLRASLHAETRGRSGPGAIAAAMHESLYQATEIGHFATFFLATLSRNGDQLRFANAGHNPSLLVHGGELDRLLPTGPPLAALEGVSFAEERRPFRSGDTLVLYSDGITECPGADPMYGEERLEQLVLSLAAGERSAEEIGREILEDVRKFAGKSIGWDDVTLVVVRRR